MILTFDMDQRNVRVPPLCDRDPLLGPLQRGILGEIEHDFPGVERTSSPSHYSVAPRLTVYKLAQSTVALIAAEDEHVRRASGGTVERLVAQEIDVREVPREAA